MITHQVMILKLVGSRIRPCSVLSHNPSDLHSTSLPKRYIACIWLRAITHPGALPLKFAYIAKELAAPFPPEERGQSIVDVVPGQIGRDWVKEKGEDNVATWERTMHPDEVDKENVPELWACARGIRRRSRKKNMSAQHRCTKECD